jgi:hypothetical protein
MIKRHRYATSTPLRNLQRRAAFIAPFTSEVIDDNKKMFIKGLALDGGRANFLKSRRDVSFKKGLSNEPTFGLIHLAGQYL